MAFESLGLHIGSLPGHKAERLRNSGHVNQYDRSISHRGTQSIG